MCNYKSVFVCPRRIFRFYSHGFFTFPFLFIPKYFIFCCFCKWSFLILSSLVIDCFGWVLQVNIVAIALLDTVIVCISFLLDILFVMFIVF